MTELEPVLISSLNDYVFCPRRCAFHQIEGVWADNEHTVISSLLHERADEPGYETDAGVTLLRALPLVSGRYGLTGRADIVEVREDGYIPVEYKKGKRRKFDNDDVQLCAQALCLEEMFACEVAVVAGKGKLVITGLLEKGMEESAQAAMSYVRSRAAALGLDPDFYQKLDVHVHFPEFIRKDGPSAGVTMATSLAST